MPVLHRKTKPKKEKKEFKRYQWIMQIGVVLLLGYVIGKDYFLSRSEELRSCKSELHEIKSGVQPKIIANNKHKNLNKTEPLFSINTTKKSTSENKRMAACGDELKLHLLLISEDEKILFNTVEEKKPFVIKLGEGKLSSLERGLEGIKTGEQRQIIIPKSMMTGSLIDENEALKNAHANGDKKIGTITELIDFFNPPVEHNNNIIKKLVFKQGNGKKILCGNQVKIAYIAQDVEGNLLNESRPLNFKIGDNNLPKNFVNLITEMTEEEEILAFTSMIDSKNEVLRLPEKTAFLQIKLMKINP